MRKLSTFVLSGSLLLAGAGHATEILQATAMKLGGAIQTGQLVVYLHRYTTDEERAAWRQAFAEGGQEALVRQWQEAKVSVGTCSFARSLGYDLRAAISVPLEGGGRKIYMATDRPIAGFEAMRNTRSEEYPIGWIEVVVDAEGKGEGRMVGMAAFSLENGQLVMTTYGTEPVRLSNVKIRDKE